MSHPKKHIYLYFFAFSFLFLFFLVSLLCFLLCDACKDSFCKEGKFQHQILFLFKYDSQQILSVILLLYSMIMITKNLYFFKVSLLFQAQKELEESKMQGLENLAQCRSKTYLFFSQVCCIQMKTFDKLHCIILWVAITFLGKPGR